MAQITLNDIGIYKDRIFYKIIRDKDIGRQLLGDIYNEETVAVDLPYHHIYPYLYIDGTQTETKSYICIEIDVPRTSDFTYKDMKVIIWVCTHKDLMKCSVKGYSGTMVDVLSTMIDNLLNSSRNFGIGRLKLESSTYIKPNNTYYGRQLIYNCSEFNLKDKL